MPPNTTCPGPARATRAAGFLVAGFLTLVIMVSAPQAFTLGITLASHRGACTFACHVGNLADAWQGLGAHTSVLFEALRLKLAIIAGECASDVDAGTCQASARLPTWQGKRPSPRWLAR